MEGHGNIHHHQYHHHQYQYPYVDHLDEEEEEEEEERMGGMVGVYTGDSSSSRLPQWSNEETKEFLKIRAELDKTFMETKRNKLLWEVISSKLREKGFHRSAQQCKCKWKNLVTRYKGCETIEIEAMRQQQFPFYNDMQAIFTARVWTTTELDTDIIPSRKNKAATTSSSDDNPNEGCSMRGRPRKNLSKKAKFVNGGDGNNNIISKGVKEMVGEMMRQYAKMEGEWRVAEEAREEKRRRMEREWRMRMVELAEERVAMERRWREREEQRWLREEARAQKRDALIVALLNKITRDENN